MVTGTCLCGAVRYEVDEPLQFMVHCHCSMCRKHHGANFATFVAAPAKTFRWRSDEKAVHSYPSSAQGTRRFCGSCGSAAPSVSEEMSMAFIPAGNLEGELGIRPQMHVFVGSKAPWHEITDELPQHAEYPPEFAAPSVPRPRVAEKEGITQGSCLCGEVRWEIDGPPSRAFNCHCSRCRLARSAAFATNVFYPADAVHLVHGADAVSEYKVPDARFFTNSFCSHCGGKTPRISAERSIAVVPAGSLDSDPGIRAAAHIFTGSKASWFDITDSTPQFAELPPKKS